MAVRDPLQIDNNTPFQTWRRTISKIIQGLYTKDATTGFALLANGMGRSRHIESVTAASDASITINVSPTAATGCYKVLLRNLRPVTDDDDLALRISGASGASDYQWQLRHESAAAADAQAVDAADSEIQVTLGTATNGVGDAAGEGASGTIWVFPTDTVCETIVVFAVHHQNTAGQICSQFGCGLYQSTTAITSITILFLGSNIETGKISVFEEYAG